MPKTSEERERVGGAGREGVFLELQSAILQLLVSRLR